MEAHFIILQAKGNPKKFSITRGQTFIIGRSSADCNIVLEDELCSSKHCKISYEGSKLFIEDLDSKNGIFLNGKKICHHEIKIHDKFKLGNTTLYLNPKIMNSNNKAMTAILKGYAKDDYGISLESKKNNSPKNHNQEFTRTLMESQRQNILNTREAKRTKSRVQIAIEQSVIQGIDFTLGIFLFIIIIYSVSLSNSEIYKLRTELSFFQYIFNKKMISYSVASTVCSLLFYNINKKLPGGSLGKRILNKFK